MKTFNATENFNYLNLHNLEDFFRFQIIEKEINLSKMVIVACQHILEPQMIMFQKMLELGILAENIFILGKAYSTNMDVLNELKTLGVFAMQSEYNPNTSFDIQHKENCEIIWKYSQGKRVSAEKVIVLDDGGVLLSVANESRDILKIVGVEQTSSGFRKLESQEILFPIFNVARSRIKLELETPFIIDVGLPRIIESFSYLGNKNPKILIIGMGPIGLELQKRFCSIDFPVIGYDKIDGEKNIIDIIINSNIDVVIGATGSQVITHDEILILNSLLNKKIILISMSSSDREFEIWQLRDMFSYKKIHDDIKFENTIICNGGFPITFKGNRIEAMPEQIEKTLCLLFSGVCLGILNNNLEKKIIDIPENVLELIEF